MAQQGQRRSSHRSSGHQIDEIWNRFKNTILYSQEKDTKSKRWIPKHYDEVPRCDDHESDDLGFAVEQLQLMQTVVDKLNNRQGGFIYTGRAYVQGLGLMWHSLTYRSN